jgi:hypothetical protein
LPKRLGGEERLEGARPDGVVHASAGVSHGDLDIVAGLGVVLAGHIRLREVYVLRADYESASVRHGVARVDGEVEQRALKLVRVAQHRPDTIAHAQLDRDLGSDRALDHVSHALDERIGLDGARL